MGEAKPFETTTISAPHGAPVRVRNRDDGGERGIRTLGGVAPTTVFETAPFDHSGTSPQMFAMTLIERRIPYPEWSNLIQVKAAPQGGELAIGEVF